MRRRFLRELAPAKVATAANSTTTVTLGRMANVK
jgi:hypothetical protein